jgi:hypothetical protein
MATMPKSAPLDPEIFDDEATIEQSGRLADLLRLWNSLVRAELGTVQSFPVYDRESLNQQYWHQRLVVVAAVTGSLAVLFAILQLAADAEPELLGPIAPILERGEYLAAVLALIAVVLGLGVAFHTRWQLLRMKAEQYRFLKFQFLLHGGDWLERPEADRRERLQTLLAGIHALDKHDAHDWSQGTFSLVDDEPALIAKADAALTEDLVRYFREKRIGSQREYFLRQAHHRHQAERKTWIIPPTCFFLSIVCALLHFSIEIFGHSSGHHGIEAADAGSGALMIACLIGAAAFPVVGAMVRTIRTAFEFGRNANRFEGVARILAEVDRQLQAATSHQVKLELLREAEFILQHENRSWMRLMIEAEWFG